MTATVDSLVPDVPASWLDRWQARVRRSVVLRRRIDVLAPVLVTLLAAVLRLWNLGHPHELVFDETYYVKDAWSQWNLGYPADWPDGADKDFAAGHTDVFLASGSFVVHPPLGKWIIGLFMWIFGPDSSFGWRFGAALFGTATVLLVYLLAKRLTSSTVFATVAGVLMAIDGLAIVLSRVSLLDIFLTFFIVLAMLFAVIDRQRHLARLAQRLAERDPDSGWGPMLWGRPWLFAAGAAAGAACAVKWSGLYVLAAIGIYAVVTDALARRRAGVRYWPQDAARQGVASFVLLVPVAFVVYLASWTGWLVTDGGYDRQAAQNPFAALWIYHQAIYQFHVGLTTPHSYASPAWQWPLLIRPTSMYWHQDTVGQNGCTWSSNCVQAISSIPNPFIWWGGIAAAVFLLIAFAVRRDWRHAVVLTGIAATYLPWLMFPERTIFQFYTIAMVPFTVLALTFALREIAGFRSRVNHRRVSGQRTVWVFLGVVTVLSAFWYPVWVGMKVPYVFWLVHNWIPTWI
ncbi:phospholipid carrier-dependent glycosyltransferase [Microbacterium protaetiae]|uniref:Polyprenol-phosphate-mannose--protein mannosyltransferase n=1 Tax=Microbacterium protaetiae TaxID=2509458 RepID=A0A4P6EBE6_9MICO|nr:phospholipid carrier-dependent glycosyltransferase [Microbacterium protaetiae]QAY58603.1 phospholipid carrier-dependent glycosyltransferase [Microbacterium protaetiae]